MAHLQARSLGGKHENVTRNAISFSRIRETSVRHWGIVYYGNVMESFGFMNEQLYLVSTRCQYLGTVLVA